MRKLIAGMKMSLDGKIEGPEGIADWVDAWSDDYGMMAEVDACLLGAGMYAGYERYWTAIQKAPTQPHEMTGKVPTPDEVRYARFVTETPHHVLSATLTSAAWPSTRFVRSVADVRAMKEQPGKGIYVVGGARTTSSLVAARLVDELRVIVYPLVAGEGTALFATAARQRFDLRDVRQLSADRVLLTYAVDGA